MIRKTHHLAISMTGLFQGEEHACVGRWSFPMFMRNVELAVCIIGRGADLSVSLRVHELIWVPYGSV